MVPYILHSLVPSPVTCWWPAHPRGGVAGRGRRQEDTQITLDPEERLWFWSQPPSSHSPATTLSVCWTYLPAERPSAPRISGLHSVQLSIFTCPLLPFRCRALRWALETTGGLHRSLWTVTGRCWLQERGPCTGFLLGGSPPTAVLLNAQVPGGAQPLRIPAAKEREGCVGEQT